jgi:hypothetical protein
MPYNLPSYDTSRFSIGPCVIYLGAAGTTPTVDVGAVESGAELVTTRTKEEIFQGFPKTLVAQFATQETAVLKLSGIEWNVNNLVYALGSGSTTVSSSQEVIDFGGDISFTEVALKIVHQTPNGWTVNVYIWQAQGDGAITLNFSDTHHKLPYTFNAMIPWDNTSKSCTDWGGGTLAAGKQLFKVVIQK